MATTLPSTSAVSTNNTIMASGPGSASMGIPPSRAALAFKEGVTELTSFQLSQSDTGGVPCENQGVVITKSSQATANGACPHDWRNVSCSCIDGTQSTREWVFHVKKIPKTPATGPIPTSLDTADVIAVSTIGQFALPDAVQTLRIIGPRGRRPTNFEFDLISPYDRDRSKIALVASETQNHIKEVEVANIDLSSLDITEDFLPPSVTALTFHNAKIDTLPSPFLLKRWNKLISLDMSSNMLATWYGGEMTVPPPDLAACTIETLNLSGNAYTSIPSSLIGMGALKSLNFSNNPVTNFTISDTLYNKISSLETFTFDGIDYSSISSDSCGDASYKTAHNIGFCVVPTAESEGSTTSSNGDGGSGTNTTLIYVAIAGGVVILALATAIFIMHRKRRQATRGKAFSRTHDDQDYTSLRRGFGSGNSASGDGGDRLNATLSLSGAHTHVTIDPTLLNDPLIITSRLDHKELLFGEALKSGGFGVVYTGVYKRRRVAIKQIRPEHTGDTRLLESFLKEIALMASLSHPRIVEYIGCAWDSLRNLSVVTELMARGDLREVLQFYKHQRMLNGSGNGSASGNVDGVTTLSWANGHKTRLALHIAEGLQYLHTLSPKVIHRDLKSKNVLVSSEFEAKLTDFGISREGRFEQTHMTAGIGTSFWIAPEVLAGVRYDERADIFSFGVVLSELDTDDFPYWNARSAGAEGGGGGVEDRGATQEGLILRRVLAGEMRPQFSESCPLVIKVLADQCLEGDPSKRPTASEIVQYLMPLTHPDC